MLGIGTQRRPSKACGGSGKLGMLCIEFYHFLARHINKFIQCLVVWQNGKQNESWWGRGWGLERGRVTLTTLATKGRTGKESAVEKGEPAIKVNAPFHVSNGWRATLRPGTKILSPEGFALRPDVWLYHSKPILHHHSLYRSNTQEPQTIPWGVLNHQFQPVSWLDSMLWLFARNFIWNLLQWKKVPTFWIINIF